MDQVKIGKFIAESRKKQGMTQAQLAEQLGITDRAVSKWENGKSLPDSAIMQELCQILHITVNELLNGEEISSEDYTKKMEEKLLEMARSKECSDRTLLRLRLMLNLALLGIIILSLTFKYLTSSWWGATLVGYAEDGIIILYAFMNGMILYNAGYYRCTKCGHTHMPSFGAILGRAFFFLMIRPRFYCSQCGKKTRHKKVLKRE